MQYIYIFRKFLISLFTFIINKTVLNSGFQFVGHKLAPKRLTKNTNKEIPAYCQVYGLTVRLLFSLRNCFRELHFGMNIENTAMEDFGADCPITEVVFPNH